MIYLETKDVVETTLALDNYKRACDSGRGAVFLSVARGTLVVVVFFRLLLFVFLLFVLHVQWIGAIVVAKVTLQISLTSV